MKTKMMLLLFSPLIPVVSFLSVFAGSSFVLYQKSGHNAGDNFGYAVAAAGDVDGDGKEDFIVGAPDASPNGINKAGSVFVYSGATGALLFQKDGADSGGQFGIAVAGVGDVNGDGRVDFLVGDPSYEVPGAPGRAFVYSGFNGSLLFQLDGQAAGDRFGWSVNGIGDMDGDGHPDFIIGAPEASGGGFRNGSVYVYSGQNGSLITQLNGTYNTHFGFSVSGSGDVNRDGVPDFIVGTAWAGAGGAAYVYSGIDRSLLFQKDGANAGDGLGISVADAGDVDGDGFSDFIVGAEGTSSSAGSAYLYSGKDGSLLYEKDGLVANAHFGRSVAGGSDMNGDGKPDFVVGAPFGGSAFVYSGIDGSLLFSETNLGGFFGFPIALTGDMTWDNRAEVVIGAGGSSPDGLSLAGLAYLYSLCPSRGDMNGDGVLTPSDPVLMLNCVFTGTGICAGCFADLNCDGALTASDVVFELRAVFLGTPISCLQ